MPENNSLRIVTNKAGIPDCEFGVGKSASEDTLYLLNELRRLSVTDFDEG